MITRAHTVSEFRRNGTFSDCEAMGSGGARQQQARDRSMFVSFFVLLCCGGSVRDFRHEDDELKTMTCSSGETGINVSKFAT